MKSVIVYQAYGPLWILEQNLFSILSLFKTHLGLPEIHKILVYTDQPSFFRSFFGDHPLISYQEMTAERLKKWRGQIDFVHRVKVEMLIHAAELYPQNNLMYFDGDTYFSGDPQKLFQLVNAHHSLMHEAEGTLAAGADPMAKKIGRFVKKSEFHLAGKPLKIPIGTMMWNAGVLGFSPDFQSELKNVLSLTDQAYTKYQKHVIEQLAFSYFLATKTRIHSASEFVCHYWRQKDEFNSLIHEFLEKSKNLETGLELYDSIVWPGPAKMKKKFFKKLLDKFIAQ